MTDERDISRRRLIGAMGTIGGAAALGGASTMAFFADEEAFANNRLVAGELDLKIAWQEQYFGAAAEQTIESGAGSASEFLSLPEATLESYPDTAQGAGASFAELTATDPCTTQQSLYADAPDDLDPSDSLRSNNDDTVVDGQVKPLVSLQDVKPSDFGLVRFKFILCDNPGYVWSTGSLQTIEENGENEPERKDPQSSGPNAANIGDEILVRLFQDLSGSAVEDFFAGLSTSSGPELIQAVFDFFKLNPSDSPAPSTLNEFTQALSTGVGVPLDGAPASGGGGTTQAGGDLFLYDLSTIGGLATSDRECFDSSTGAASLGIVWGLPADHANEIQSDSVAFDVGFYAEQCRHNDGSGLSNTD